MNSNNFYGHLKEAIQINRQRKAIYAQLSNQQSLAISNFLITSEVFSLPIARYFDWQGSKFNKAGIAIIADDFVAMNNIEAVHQPPQYQQLATQYHLRMLKYSVRSFKKRLKYWSAKVDFQKICQEAAYLLEKIDSIELAAQAHFAMLRHLVESIGYASVNAITYAKLSANKTQKLSIRLIKTQAIALNSAIRLDIRAQKIHQLGVGIIVNDVPPIPFLARWQQIEKVNS